MAARGHVQTRRWLAGLIIALFFLAVAGVYRKQAAAETNPTTRRALLDRAINTYSQLLTDETTGVRAKTELESTRAELQALPQ